MPQGEHRDESPPPHVLRLGTRGSLLARTQSRIVADAVVTPNNVEELRTVIALAVRHDTPMTLRGGGTTNFGQSLPLHGGIVIDVRRLDRMVRLTESSATAEGGALQGDVDRAARERGREMTILPTTFASATLVSIAHRPAVAEYHERKLTLVPYGERMALSDARI